MKSFIRKLFFNGLEALEERLRRIQHIPNIQQISNEVGLPKAANLGADTDELILDAWVEFLVADLLLSLPNAQQVEKVIRSQNRPAVDFSVVVNGKTWVVEVSRIRKKNFTGETYSEISPECEDPANMQIIQAVLHNKLRDKDEQLYRFTQSEGTTYERQIVALKTSQESYQDCRHVVEREAKTLLKSGNYSSISHLLLIPDIKNYEFVDRS